jgi:tRNA dimethylallyltransferase
MIAQGWIDEVRTLLAGGYSRFASAMRSFGYKQLIDYLDQEIDLDFAVQQIKQQTRRYAKRQLTWFRREPRIKWVGRDQLLSGESIRLYSHSCKSGN